MIYYDTENKKSGSYSDPGKEKDMITMNRFDYFNSERQLSASLYSKKEWGLVFMRSSLDKAKTRILC